MPEPDYAKITQKNERIPSHRITTSICANILGVSNDTALRELSKLKSKDIIKQMGIGRGIYYVLK